MRKATLTGALILLAGFNAVTLHADIMVRDAKANIIYQYSNGVMYQGHARNNKKLFKFDAGRQEIWSMNGKRLAFWKASESALYPGNGGRPMYIFADKGAHPGSKGAKAVIYIDGRKIYQGNGPGGKLILYPDSPLPIPVGVYLAHSITGGKPAAPSKLKVDFAAVPYGYFLGKKGEGKIMLSLRGNKIYFNDTARGTPAYTYVSKGQKFYRGDNIQGEPAFSMADNGTLFKGGVKSKDNLVMVMSWLNFYSAGKSGRDSIGTVTPGGENVLIEGYTDPRKPDISGRRVLLSSTLPNNRVPLAMRIFLAYLTQIDPEFKAYREANK